MNYNGFYYDLLKDEFTDSSITLIVPERLRLKLKQGEIIEATVYLSKKQQQTQARIELQLTVTNILSRKENMVSAEELKELELIKRKVSLGFRDADSFIKSRIYNQEIVKVTVLIGLSAIIDEDIKHQIREAALAYEFKFVRINLSQTSEIIKALTDFDKGDILVISRGGGENVQLFNNLTLSEHALSLQSIFFTAIGHSADIPLLQKIADRAFITPTALGQYFNDIYNIAITDFNESKTKLISDLTQLISLNYETKISDISKRLQEATISISDIQQSSERKMKELSDRFNYTKSLNWVLWFVVVLLALALLIFLSRIA
jgi:hypothetical protein